MSFVVLLATVLCGIGIALLGTLYTKRGDYALDDLGKDLARMGRSAWIHVRYFKSYTWKQRQDLLRARRQQEEEQSPREQHLQNVA